MTSIIRLFVPEILAKNKQISIKDKKYNYLINVMRRKVGGGLVLINGVDGEFSAEIIEIKKGNCVVRVVENVGTFKKSKDLYLGFGLIKRIEFIAEKGTELGVTEFFPLITQRTVIKKINSERFKANIIEAVEQSERLDLPKVNKLLKLKNFIESLSDRDFLIFCEERSKNNKKAYEVLIDLKKKIEEKKPDCLGGVYILVGPEGGFSKEEVELVKNFQNTYSISLGERILRAETATIVILGLVQDVLF
ncbi:RsmE family RNA methyltransferase [Pseudomonadota bacterium]